MSNQYPIEGLMALGIGTVFLYSYLDRFVQVLTDRIVRGFVGGAPVSTRYRSLLLHTRWLAAVATVVAYAISMVIGWGVIGRNVDAEGASLFVDVIRFLSLIAAASWLVLAPFWYLQLASVIRQAEAD